MTKAKIYTRSGDRGETSLVGGARVSKADVRLEAYGTLDELNSSLGVVRLGLAGPLDAKLRRVQNALFNLGSQLACEDDAIRARLPNVSASDVSALEADCDQWEATLPPLTGFILPGGSEAAARTHVARTVCRRVERLVQRASEAGVAVEATQLGYLNRLSDWLFLLARVFNRDAGVADVGWEKS